MARSLCMQILIPPGLDALSSETHRRTVGATVADRLRRDWPLALTVLVTVVVTLGHEPYRDEWQAWMIARDAGAPWELIGNLRYEGHPWLWYVPLWLVSRVSRDIVAGQMLCAATAVAIQYTIWRHAPFSRATRALLIVGYFLAYEYAVFVRAYGLGALLLVLAATAIVRNRSMFAGVALALACLTSAFAAATALAIAVGVWGRDPRRLLTRDHIALGLVLAAAALSYAMTVPPPDALHSGWRGAYNDGWALSTIGGIWQGTVPIRFGDAPWNYSGIGQPWRALLGLAVFGGGALALRDCARARRAWLLGTALLLVLVYGKNFGSHRHTGHWFLLGLVCAWIQVSERRPNAWLKAIGAVVIAGGLIGTVQAVVTERAEPFSAAPATARWIDENLPANAVLIGEPDFTASAVAGAADRTFWYPRTGDVGTFVRWTNDEALDQGDLENRAIDYAESTAAPVYLVIGLEALQPSSHLELVAEFTDTHVREERYWIYRLVS